VCARAATWGFGTRAILAGQEPDPTTGAVVVPISLATTFLQDSPGVHKVRPPPIHYSFPFSPFSYLFLFKRTFILYPFKGFLLFLFWCIPQASFRVC
jgi:hypothetical protein